MRTYSALVLMLTAIVGLSGCSSPRVEGGRLSVRSGEYDRAFDAAADTLVSAGYTLDRVDAAAGVLTTTPRPSALLRRETTTVRVEFVPRASFGRIPSDEPRTQIDPGISVAGGTRAALGDTDLIASVTAVRTRIYSPVLRPEPLDARFTTRARDPLLEQRLGDRRIEQVIARDEDEEARIAGTIGVRLAD